MNDEPNRMTGLSMACYHGDHNSCYGVALTGETVRICACWHHELPPWVRETRRVGDDQVMRFYLGVHRPNWLDQTTVPLFVSHRTLRTRKRLPRATCQWALDSGGFSELSLHGAWVTKPADYIAAVRRYRDEIGGLQWAAPQDWMCEPHMLARTGLTVTEHQRRTVDNFLTLCADAPDLPWVPVLQGWQVKDYLACAELYLDAGVDLSVEPLVGLGTVCRRQHTGPAHEIVETLRWRGIRLHGFGVKAQGLTRFGDLLVSSDSMAWSFAARRQPVRLPGHTHKTCANCLVWALRWRERLLSQLDPVPTLWGAA